MICHTCCEEAVSNEAGGKSFWYCRTCKVEVLGHKRIRELLGPSDLDLGELTPEEQQEFEEWLDSVGTNSDDGPYDGYYVDDDTEGCD